MAEKLLRSASDTFPQHAGILNNLSNCLADQGKLNEAISCLIKALESDNKSEYRLQLSKLLLQGSYPLLALDCFQRGLTGYKLSDAIQFLLNYALNSKDPIHRGRLLTFCSKLEEYFHCDYFQLTLLYANLASTMIATIETSGPSDPDEVRQTYTKAKQNFLSFIDNVGIANIKPSFLENWHTISWNVGIFLAKSGVLEGWSLYEHGLLTPAKGPQQFQRALKKPFRSDELRLWKGEDLKHKHLLILGEQAIGDTLMFIAIAPLIKDLYNCRVSLYLPHRCARLVAQSYPDISILSEKDDKSHLSAHDYDFMVPAGSLPQYFLEHYKSYSADIWDLRPALKKSLNIKESFPPSKIFIGVSWQGGAGPERLNKKSINLLTLVRMIERNQFASSIVLVDLQYGKSYDIFRKASEASTLDFYSIEAITAMGDDFENWMELVNEVDLVVSVANTTVHGAAAVHKPTFCMLTESADWRWLYPNLHSDCQWYRTVTASYRSNNDWSSIESELDSWLSDKIRHIASRNL